MFWTSFLLPYFIHKRLFGDRKRFGLVSNKFDPDWAQWESRYLDFYLATQKGLIGTIVTHSGYKVLKGVNLAGKRVLEIGPGIISHHSYWQGKPIEYTLVDIQPEMLKRSAEVLTSLGIMNKQILAHQSEKLPKDYFDVIVSFNSLEHLHPLPAFIKKYESYLKTGGHFVGAIPAEGGIAWGLGRFLTTRRWFLKNTSINPDKIICWEHPNFAPHIVKEMSKVFSKVKISFWPFPIPWLDVNLTVRFIFRKN